MFGPASYKVPVKMCYRLCDRVQIPLLVELGITAIELLPLFEYDELEFQRMCVEGTV